MSEKHWELIFNEKSYKKFKRLPKDIQKRINYAVCKFSHLVYCPGLTRASRSAGQARGMHKGGFCSKKTCTLRINSYFKDRVLSSIDPTVYAKELVGDLRGLWRF